VGAIGANGQFGGEIEELGSFERGAGGTD